MSLPEVNSTSESATQVSPPAELVPTELEDTQSSAGGKRRILTVVMQLGLMRIAVSLAGLARNKVLAVYLKPEGFGAFTQLVNIVEVVNVFVQFGTIVSLSRNTAAAGNAQSRQRQLETANFLTVSLAVGTLALLIPLLVGSTGSWALSKLGLQSGFQEKAILIALLSITPIEALRNNYLSFLSGLLDIKGISTKRSLAVVVATVVAIPLVITFGLAGACIQTALASLFLAFLLGARCKQQGYRPLAFSWHKDAAKMLALLGVASLLSGFALNSSDTLIRGYLISHWGLAENGVYQAAVALCAQVTAVILASIGTYAIGTLSQSRDPKILALQIENLLRVILPLSTISLGLVGLLSRPLFALLFSSQFYEGAKFLPLLLASSYIQASAWVVGAPLLGGGLIRIWTTIQLAGVAIRYGSFILLAPLLGIYSVPVGLFGAMLFDLLANLIFCRRPIGVTLNGRTVLRMVAGGLAVMAAAAVGSADPDWATGLLCAVLLCSLSVVMVWSEANTAFRRFAMQ
jgi:O-antigen/teichoic acid export membrane protein